MVSTSNSGSSGLGPKPGRDHCVVFWTKRFIVTVRTAKATSDALASHPGKGGGGLAMLFRCYMLQKPEQSATKLGPLSLWRLTIMLPIVKCTWGFPFVYLHKLPLTVNTTKSKTCLTDTDIRVLHCMDAYSHQTGTCLVSGRAHNTLLSVHFSGKLGDRSSYSQVPRRVWHIHHHDC